VKAVLWIQIMLMRIQIVFADADLGHFDVIADPDHGDVDADPALHYHTHTQTDFCLYSGY
jgi:hypothetical protein